MAEALKTSGALNKLNIRTNSIGAEGARALAEALKTNRKLKTLNLKVLLLKFTDSLRDVHP